MSYLKERVQGMKMQSGSTHVVVIGALVAALLGALGFIFWQNFVAQPPAKETISQEDEQPVTPEKDAYTDWSTYKSKQYAYSVKYPKDWWMAPETETDGLYLRNFDPESKPETEAGYPEGSITVRVLVESDDDNFKVVHGSNVEEWYESLGRTEVKNGPMIYRPSEVKLMTVNGVSAKSTKAEFTETNENIFFVHDGSLYNISLYPYGISSDETVKVIIDSIEPTSTK